MRAPGKLWVAVFMFGAAGAALFIVLLIRHNLAAIGAAIGAAGWGIALVVAFHAIVLLTNVFAWQVLFPPKKRVALGTLYWMRWVGESVQNLIPATAVGGEIVRARLVATRGVPGAVAAATVIGDITIGIFAQILFTLSG